MAYFRTHRGLVLLIPDYIYRRIRGFLQKNDKTMEKDQQKAYLPYHFKRHPAVLTVQSRKQSYHFSSCDKETRRRIDSAKITNVDRSKSFENRFILPGGILSLTDRDEDGLRKRILQRIYSRTCLKTIPERRVIDLSFILSGSREVMTSLGRDGVYAWAVDSYLFMEKTYGADNIVGAELHMDERTPHIHIDVVPLVEKDGIMKLTTQPLRSIEAMDQTRREYWKAVRKYGFDPMRTGVHTKHYSPWVIQAEWEDKFQEYRVRVQIEKEKIESLQKEMQILEGETENLKKEICLLKDQKAVLSGTDRTPLPDNTILFSNERILDYLPNDLKEEFIEEKHRMERLHASPRAAAKALQDMVTRAAAIQKKADEFLFEGTITKLQSSLVQSRSQAILSEGKAKDATKKLKKAIDACRELDSILSGVPDSEKKERERAVEVMKALSKGTLIPSEKLFPSFLAAEINLKETVPWFKDLPIEKIAELSVPNIQTEDWRPSQEGILHLGEKGDIPINISYLTCGDSPSGYPKKISWEGLSEEEKNGITSFIEERILRMPPCLRGELKLMEEGKFKGPCNIDYSKGEVDFRTALWYNNLDYFASDGYRYPFSGRIPEESEALPKAKDVDYMETVSSKLWQSRWEETQEKGLGTA